MISPKNMKIIRIEITNACPHSCSNCMRFCGWHEKPFFMSSRTFWKAVKSLKDFPGMIAIAGGEPALHPRFAEFAEFLRRNFPDERAPKKLIVPEDDMHGFRKTYLNDRRAKLGLFSTFGPGCRKHFTVIGEVFRYRSPDCSAGSAMRQPLLLPRGEFGIPDDEWRKLRDGCRIQTQGSASVTPRGAFFCEVAAALDTLFDGPGGWPVEPGWWLRRPQEFGDQLQWCEYCGACLPAPERRTEDGIDVVSPTMAERLSTRDAPKARERRYEIFTREDYERNRISADAEIRTHTDEEDAPTVPDAVSPTPQNIVVCAADDGLGIIPAGVPAWKRITMDDAAAGRFDEWLLYFHDRPPLEQNFGTILSARVYNPRILYHGDGWVFIHRELHALSGFGAALNPSEYAPSRLCHVGRFRAPDENLNFSILIPTYNVASTLEKSLECVLNQDYGNFHVFIVDDCSTDGTWDLIGKLREAHPEKIRRVARHAENQSAACTRMDLIDMADGDYAIWVDADDEISTNFCSCAAYMLRSYPADILDFPFRTRNVGSIRNYGFRDEEFQFLRGRDVYDFFCLRKKNPYCLWSKAIRTDLLKRSKIERTRIDLVDDMAIVFPLYWNARSYVSLNTERMYTYNFGSGSWGCERLTLEKFRRNCLGVRRAYDLNYRFLLEHSPEKKYFDAVCGRGRIMPMYADISRLKPEERFEAAAFFKELFPDESL